MSGTHSTTALPAGREKQETTLHTEAWPDPRRAWAVVILLALAFTSSFIDRQILSLLVEPVKADLNISDTQFSLLVGLAFSLFYSICGVPLGYLADRKSRRLIVSAGVLTWSMMTTLCGFAQNFAQLFVARMGVGVGEATLTPSAASLIADYFPKERRGAAMAVYATGVYWGSGLALMIGGGVIAMIADASSISVPLIGEIRPWQTVFLMVGLPGLPLAGLMLLIREPRRRGLVADGGDPSAGQLLPFAKANVRALLAIFVGFTLLGMVVIAYLTWIPALFIRTFGWTAAEIGFGFGVIVTVFGSGGILFGGWLSDRLTRRGHADAVVRAGLYGGMVATPIAAVAPLLPTPPLLLVGAAVALFAATSTQALPVVAIQTMAPNNLRARLAAFYFLFGSLLIFTLGPTSVALVTDFVFGDPTMVRYSLAIACAVFAPLGVLLVATGLKPYRRAVEAASWE